MNTELWSVKDIAEFHSVSAATARRWLEIGWIDGAFKEAMPPFPSVWKVPAENVRQFSPPKPGVKPSDNPSQMALAQRNYRASKIKGEKAA